MTNIILATDSYKLTHYNQYPKGTEVVYSYFESRVGAEFPNTVFFGLQAIIKEYLEGVVVTQKDVDAAQKLATAHFGDPTVFNYRGWEYIVEEHGGRLPVRIKAVDEGTPVPTGNVLMTVENTDPKCFWLTNALESLLTHVWYPSTVASLSRSVKEMLADKLTRAGEPLDGLDFMLHDFGYRGASSHESAAIGGLGHLVNFLGTDTLPAMLLGIEQYGADLQSLAFSVPATEHSVMTSLGRDGEMQMVSDLLDSHPTGILSVVADSFDYYGFVDAVCTTFKDRIMARDGKFVIRPDSVTNQHPTPHLLVEWTLRRLERAFPGGQTEKAYKRLDPHVGVLWGDGIDPLGIEKIVNGAMAAGFSPSNLVFGMGGGLLQKVNRDTQRFAFKASANLRNGEWVDVSKDPLDATKKSKAGKLKLLKIDGKFETIKDIENGDDVGLLKTVFENGELVREINFAQVRENAAL